MSNPFLGEIRVFGGNFAPLGWAYCSGQILLISQNSALFTLIGTTYGGNGTTTFALPDLRGRVVVGQGDGPSTSARVVGEAGGTETVTLTANQMPTHSHAVTAYDTLATSSAPSGLALAKAPPANPSQDSLFYLNAGVGSPNTAALPADTLSVAGGSQPHENMAPFLALSYIIALEGVFPSRN
jgi:microcystin-dependent protein